MTPPRDDPELRGPAQLAPPRVPVVRLNRRVLYVVGAVLVLVFVRTRRATGPELAARARRRLGSGLAAPAGR